MPTQLNSPMALMASCSVRTERRVGRRVVCGRLCLVLLVVATKLAQFLSYARTNTLELAYGNHGIAFESVTEGFSSS